MYMYVTVLAMTSQLSGKCWR